jgi:hypothetical protein
VTLAERIDMARVFRVTIDLHPPSEQRPQYCLESYEKVRTAAPNRVLHFALGDKPTEEDLQFVGDVIGAQLQSLIIRLVGIQAALEI